MLAREPGGAQVVRTGVSGGKPPFWKRKMINLRSVGNGLRFCAEKDTTSKFGTFKHPTRETKGSKKVGGTRSPNPAATVRPHDLPAAVFPGFLPPRRFSSSSSPSLCHSLPGDRGQWTCHHGAEASPLIRRCLGVSGGTAALRRGHRALGAGTVRAGPPQRRRARTSGAERDAVESSRND